MAAFVSCVVKCLLDFSSILPIRLLGIRNPVPMNSNQPRIGGTGRMGAWVRAVLALWALTGCASPAQRIDSLMRGKGFERSLVEGNGFEHLVYARAGLNMARRVHVYLEGDGLPWATPDRVSADPTPRYPLALHLMARDPAPSLLLGRPCYYGVSDAGPCTPWLWTHGRYSEQVVGSMAAALRRLLSGNPGARIALLGYSGGGALAMLLAERLESVERVVTVAANLDIAAWTDLHGYSPLTGSLNPVERPILPVRIERIHLAGETDQRVPVRLVRDAAVNDPIALVRVVPGFDHRCCWEEQWPAILKSFDGAPGKTH